jgi:NAD(P)-dependent dehydrogenase (short-subunit alcohol dehydrogenase family)
MKPIRLDYSNGMSTPSQTSASSALASTVAVVTGGSRGIGLAIAAAFLERGARVAIAGRNQKYLDAAVSMFSTDALLAVQADVGNSGCRFEAV